MKKILFIIITFLIGSKVYALDNTFYYGSEKVTEMWIQKINSNQNRLAHPYVLRRRSDNTYVYCLEAFIMLENDIEYTKTDDLTKYGLSKESLDYINLLSYYGYGYKNHTSIKWYGITQYLIWKETDKNADIFFVDDNFNRKDLYKDEINEIKGLIKNHLTKPDYLKEYIVDVNSNLDIDSNIDLSNYTIESDIDYKIENNHIIFNELKEGNYKVKLKHINNRFNFDYALYYNSSSQNIIIPGNSSIYDIEYEFSIKVTDGKLKINKSNSLTNELLSGATYGIYINNELVKKVTTKNGVVETNLSFGEYTIKELVAPKGYKLDSNEYKIVINENNLEVNLDLVDDKIIIKVPDTRLNFNYNYLFIIIGLIGIIYGKK